MGGGHADYAGNEVYKFALNTGEWKRLTNPQPLDFIDYDWGKSDKYIKIPDTRLSPASAHSYGGMAWNPITKKIIIVSRVAANKVKEKTLNDTAPNFLPQGKSASQWEFDPVLAESLGQKEGHKAFKKLGSFTNTYPRAFMMNGNVVLGNKNSLYNISYNDDGTIKSYSKFQRDSADWGDSNAEYDASRDLIWINHGSRKALFAYTPQGVKVYEYRKPPVDGKALAFDSNNNVVVWDGCNKVGTYTPETNKWIVDDWRDKGMGPCHGGTGRVYGKWVNVEGDYFTGVASAKGGVWVYKAGRAPTDVVPILDVKTIKEITATAPLFVEGFESIDWKVGWTQLPVIGGKQAADSRFKNTSIVSDNCIKANCLRINMSKDSGAGIGVYKHILGNHDSIVMEYWLKLSENFTPKFYNKEGNYAGWGGKMIGLADTDAYPDEQCGNGGAKADGINCWSARSTFQGCADKTTCGGSGKTRIGGYMYVVGTKSNHGDFAAYDGDAWGTEAWLRGGNGTHGQLENGRWYKVQVQVTMNTPGFHNGIYRAWIDGKLAFDKTDMVYRLPNHDNLHVKSVWMNMIYGGSLVAPNVDTQFFMDELKVYKAN